LLTIGIGLSLALNLSPHLYNSEVFGSSPAFVHQEIADSKDDWILVSMPSKFPWQDSGGNTTYVETAKEKSECILKSKSHSPDINAVSYLSDGNSLNATIWLSSPLQKIPLHKMGYTISVDFHSVYDVGTDYYARVSKNPYNDTWTRTIEESSGSTDQKRMLNSSVYTSAIRYNEAYVTIALPLSYLNFPSQYKLIFTAWDQFLNDDQKMCYLVDLGTWVQIPPPRYFIKTIPSSIVLRPLEEAEVTLSVSSIADIESNISLSSKKMNDLSITFTPPVLHVMANGTESSIINVKASDNPQKRTDIVPIRATISFPSAAKLLGSNKILTNIANRNITQNWNLVIEKLPSLGISDYLQIASQTWLNPLGQIYATIAAIAGGLLTVVSALIVRKKRNKGKTTQRK
jgi:hypothetical protein